MMFHFRYRNQGQSFVEYGVCLALLACLSISGLALMGGNVSGLFSGLSNSLALSGGSPFVNPGIIFEEPKLPPAYDPSLPVVKPPIQEGGGKTCFSNGQCYETTEETPYDAEQSSGAEGINLVHGYANRIEEVLQIIENDPNADLSLREMLVQLADAGHAVALAEHRIIQAPANEQLRFNEKSTFETTRVLVQNYLAEHPQALSGPLAQIVTMAANNITAQMQDFLMTADLASANGSYNSETGVNPKFRTELTVEAHSICGSGGNAGKCTR